MSDEIRKLPKQPLNCVLAEFRFSQILKIQDHIPDIQESIRKTYPVLNRADQQTVQMAEQGIEIRTVFEWLFSTQDRKSAVIIGTDRLVFVTSSYDRFPEFSDRCLAVLSALHEVTGLSLLTRIGLRYNDFIVIEEPIRPEHIVDPQFLPQEKLSALGDGVNHYRTESSIRTKEGTLLTRSLLGRHGLALMSDLDKGLIELEYAGDAEKLVLLLDFDHYWAAEEPGVVFELGVAKDHLDRLHETARAAFWAATSEYARNEIWT